VRTRVPKHGPIQPRRHVRSVGRIRLPVGANADFDDEVRPQGEEQIDLVAPVAGIFDGTVDRITGVLYAKDLIRYRLESPGDGTVRAIQRKPLVVSQSRDLTGLLRAFQRERMHLAVVQGPDGRALGIVTLEDVLEQIVGEIEDEFEEPEPACRPLGEGDMVFRGSVLVSEANRLLGLHLPGQPQETLAGLCARLAGDGPAEGETFTVDGARLAVEAMTGRRAWSVRVTKVEETT